MKQGISPCFVFGIIGLVKYNFSPQSYFMFDKDTVAQLRGIIREEVKVPFDQLNLKIEREVDALRTDMKAEFVASERRIIHEVGEMIEQNVLPHVFRAA